MNILLANNSFLPYTMSWIYRQLIGMKDDNVVVVSNQIENKENFKFDPVYKLESDNKLKAWIRGKFNFYFGNRRIKLSKANYAQLKHILIKHQIDLVHVHFGTYGVYFEQVCNELGIPLIITFHGHDISSAFNRWPAYKKRFKQLTDSLACGIAISDEMKKRLVKLGCPEDKVKVSYLGVPTEEFPYFERTSKKTKVTFLHAGRLTAKKGVPDLILSFNEVYKHNKDVELIIVGDGEERDKVESIIGDLNIGSVVKLLGRLTDDELKNIRQQADVFVLNCRTDFNGTKEGLPISILEAASTGLPVISTLHAGIPESIVNGETGFLVPENDNVALSKAMLNLTDKDLVIKMGINASEFVKKKFDLDSCNTELRKIYQECIDLY